MDWPKTKLIYGHSAMHTLTKVGEGDYRCNDSYYARIIGYPEDIKAIDFDGGPMIGIGEVIEGLGEVESISATGIIHFKPCT